MGLQWYKQPDGTMILWDPQDPSNPLSQSPKGKQTTDTSEVARSLFEDRQGTRAPDLLSSLLQMGGAPSGGKDNIDYGKLIMALVGSSPGAAPAGDEGGQSVGATTPEGAGYTPARPTTGEETSRPAPKAGKTQAYPGGEAFVQGMIKRGWTPEEAAGAAGNVHVESGFKPAVKSSVREEQSFGFLQWNHKRLDGLKNYAAAKGKDWRDPETQMDWINLERTGGSVKYGGTDESGAYAKAFSGSGGPAEIAARFGRYVERPKDLSQSVKLRMAAADQYASMAGKAAPVAVAKTEPPPNPRSVAAMNNNVPYSNQSIDEELFSAILGGGPSRG